MNKMFESDYNILIQFNENSLKPPFFLSYQSAAAYGRAGELYHSPR